MRLERAGCTREVFAFDATVLLHEATAGAMRDLDRLATAALRETARKKRKVVERDVVTRVIRFSPSSFSAAPRVGHYRTCTGGGTMSQRPRLSRLLGMIDSGL